MHLIQNGNMANFCSMSSIIMHNLLSLSAEMWPTVYSPQTGCQQWTKVMISRSTSMNRNEELAIEPWRFTYGQLHHQRKCLQVQELWMPVYLGGGWSSQALCASQPPCTALRASPPLHKGKLTGPNLKWPPADNPSCFQDNRTMSWPEDSIQQRIFIFRFPNY